MRAAFNNLAAHADALCVGAAACGSCSQSALALVVTCRKSAARFRALPDESTDFLKAFLVGALAWRQPFKSLLPSP
jgi:hypothetical protein